MRLYFIAELYSRAGNNLSIPNLNKTTNIIINLDKILKLEFEMCDILRDCRKSSKMAILAISHVMKTDSYKCKNHGFTLFRQSLHNPQIIIFLRIVVIYYRF